MICFAQDGIEASWNFESATSRNILCSIVRVFSAYAASVGQTSACNRRKQAQLNIEVSANRAGAERRVTLSRGTDSEAAWLPGSLPPGCGPSQPHATRGPAAGTPAWAGACRAVAVVVMSGQVDQWAVLPTALPAPLSWHQEVQQGCRCPSAALRCRSNVVQEALELRPLSVDVATLLPSGWLCTLMWT